MSLTVGTLDELESDALGKALRMADQKVRQKMNQHLTDVELIILQGAWKGLDYVQIAQNSKYKESYLRRSIGPKLWKLLSDAIGEKVSKRNFRTVMERRLSNVLLEITPDQIKALSHFKEAKVVSKKEILPAVMDILR